MKLNLLLLGACLILVCFSAPAFFRWKQQQRDRKQKLLATLMKRGSRLFMSVESTSDRYFPKETKIFVIEYLLSIIEQLDQSAESADFMLKKSYLIESLSELKLGRQSSLKERVVSKEHLEQMQVGLQYIQHICRKLSDGHLISKGAAHYHITLLRYASDLGQSDLLVKQARQDLDNDKKSQALDKFRSALSLIERNGTVAGSEREVARLKFMIETVEKELFAKRDKN